MTVDAQIRRDIILLAGSRRTRTTAWDPNRPNRWEPLTVRNPHGILESYFTDSTAWDLIVNQLQSGCEITTKKLRKPPGRTADVMKIDLGTNDPVIYVKVELGSGKTYGRSFHYDDPTTNYGATNKHEK